MSAILKYIDSIMEGLKSFFAMLGKATTFFNNAASILPDFLKVFFAISIPLSIIIFVLKLK